MYSLNDDFEMRGDRCAYSLLNNDLIFGVGRAFKKSTEYSHSSAKSSSFVNSENLSDKQFDALMTPSSIH